MSTKTPTATLLSLTLCFLDLTCSSLSQTTPMSSEIARSRNMFCGCTDTFNLVWKKVSLPSLIALTPGTPAVENLVQHLDVGGEAEDARVQETAVFEKFNPLLHGGVTTSSGRGANKRKEVLSIAFVKKYIQYAKSRIHPVLTKGAADWIVNVYAALRNDDLAGNQKRVSADSVIDSRR